MNDAGFRNVMPVGYDAPLPSKDEWEMKDVEHEKSTAGSSDDPGSRGSTDRVVAGDDFFLTVDQAKTLAKLIVLHPWLEKLL